jgi:hypothetical protein
MASAIPTSNNSRIELFARNPRHSSEPAAANAMPPGNMNCAGGASLRVRKIGRVTHVITYTATRAIKVTLAR